MERDDEEYLQWKQQRSYINTRWSQLYELEKEWGKEAIKYLLLTNAGGAVATLSFIGTSQEIRESLPPKLALIFFIIGLVSSDIMIAYAYKTMSRLFDAWQKDVGAHDRKEFDYDMLVQRDDERVPNGVVDRILGYTSLLSFIIGSLVGVLGLLSG